MWWIATVSSTTPSPAPKWPPVTETASTVAWRNSSASCFSCSGVKARVSAGKDTVSNKGVLLFDSKSLSLLYAPFKLYAPFNHESRRAA